MTTEQREYIYQLVEDGVGSTDEILVRFRHRFPGQPYIWEDIAQVKKAYLFRRYGLVIYKKERVAAVRIFETGGSIHDVHERFGTKLTRAARWEEEWRSVRQLEIKEVKKARPVSRHTQPGHAFPGGAVFGSWTNRESIWRGGK